MFGLSYLKKYIYLLFSIVINFLLIAELRAQISYGGIPISFQDSTISKNIQTIVMPTINIDSLIQIDTSCCLDEAFRYGYSISVNFGINNTGTLETLKDGSYLWRLAILSKDALGIELNYNDFWLPDGATFFYIMKIKVRL